MKKDIGTVIRRKLFLKLYDQGDGNATDAVELGTISWGRKSGWGWLETQTAVSSGRRQLDSLEHALRDFLLHLGAEP